MLYIMAGADGSGKSTCFEMLKHYLGDKAVFIKESATSSLDEKIARVQRADALAASGELVIYDRATVLDDLIYEPIVRHKSSELLYNGTIWRILQHAKILYFTCEDEVLFERLKERGDDYVTAEMLPAIKDAYEKFFENEHLMPYRFDTTHESCVTVAAQVLSVVWHKPFRLAHIVPEGSLSVLDNKGYVMCLANIVKKDSSYAAYYSSRASSSECFVLMDNGAAENDQLTIEELVPLYEEIQPDEIVLPDTLCDSESTLQKSKAALQYLEEWYGSYAAIPFTIMAVPQGKDISEWTECAEKFVTDPRIHSIGVSKFLQMTTGWEMQRVNAVQRLEELIKKHKRYDLEVHLLGCSEQPATIGLIANNFPFVRGCDSAYGYICTQAGVNIYSSTERPSGEIDFINGRDYPNLATNLTALEVAVGVYHNEFDSRWEG